jgi:hypothetical protein
VFWLIFILSYIIESIIVCYKSFIQYENLRLDVEISSPSALYWYLMYVVGTPGWQRGENIWSWWDAKICDCVKQNHNKTNAHFFPHLLNKIILINQGTRPIKQPSFFSDAFRGVFLCH